MNFIFLILFFFSFNQLEAQDAVIAVGEAEQDLDKLVISEPEFADESGELKRVTSEVIEVIKNNFLFYKHKFNLITPEDKIINSYSSPNFESWKNLNFSYVLSSKASSKAGHTQLFFKIYSVSTGKELLSQSFKVYNSTLRSDAHHISDTLFRKITGRPSIFKSKIVFISDRTTDSREITKELYVMDFDGRRVEKLTNFNSVILSPSVSPDNSKIMFSLIATHTIKSNGKTKLIKNIDLKMLDINSGKFSTISQKPGINSGAVFSRDDNKIYLTLSFSGNADIYEMEIKSGKMRKVTSHYADDVDPSVTQMEA